MIEQNHPIQPVPVFVPVDETKRVVVPAEKLAAWLAIAEHLKREGDSQPVTDTKFALIYKFKNEAGDTLLWHASVTADEIARGMCGSFKHTPFPPLPLGYKLAGLPAFVVEGDDK
ncbi:hypothetical protein Q3C01_01110 [Bradyrhizobium sp. UFLA05-109]